MKAHFIAFASPLIFASLAVAQQASNTVVIKGCRVHPIAVSGQAQVPAQEAGVLTAINVREGKHVRAGEELGAIDDVQAKKAKRVAAAEHSAAKQKADSDVDILHSQAAAKVAEYDYLHSEEANKRTQGAVSQVEMEQKKFQWTRALYAIQQAKNEQVVNAFTSEGKQAEMEGAEDAIQRRKIKSPIDGVVQHVYPNIGEWVKPGDPVFRIIRMDKLRVEGLVNHKEASPGELIDHPVNVEVAFAKGQTASFTGKVVFVDPEVDPAGQRVYAEVDNRQDQGGNWLLRPGVGMQPTMSIQLR